MTDVWIQTASGKAVDLVNPDPSSIDPADIAEHLLKINRYVGATPGVAFSVAQHSTNVADECLSRSSSPIVALAGLLHDGHEYALGDDASPKKRAMAEIARELYGETGAEMIKHVMSEMQDRMDRAIFVRLGLPHPLPYDIARLVHAIDLQMLETEKRDLMAPEPKPWKATGFDALSRDIGVDADYRSSRGRFIDRLQKYTTKAGLAS